MEKPIIKYSGTHCFKCGKETIVPYDIKNKPVPFAVRPNVTTDNIMSNINNTTLSYMKCSSCGTRYFIDYSSGFARPVSGRYIRESFFGC